MRAISITMLIASGCGDSQLVSRYDLTEEKDDEVLSGLTFRIAPLSHVVFPTIHPKNGGTKE